MKKVKERLWKPSERPWERPRERLHQARSRSVRVAPQCAATASTAWSVMIAAPFRLSAWVKVKGGGEAGGEVEEMRWSGGDEAVMRQWKGQGNC